MDVRCDRCGTEYEFDDALVSERGTSVKCTNCGHQFKVFRPKNDSAPPEQWIIRTGDGREVVFHSLRELKAAIMGRQVLRTDRLARGTGPARTLGTIPELTSFFDDAERAARNGADARTRVPTPMGLGGPPSQMPLERASSRTLQGVAPAPHQASVGILPSISEPELPPPSIEPPTARRGASGPPGALPPMGPPEPRPLPPITPPPGEVSVSHDGDIRTSRVDFADDETSMGRPRNSGALRWVLAVVVLGSLGALGVTFGKQIVGEGTSRGAVAPSASAAPIKDLLQQGDRAMAEGKLEDAKELLIKASALAESDARVQVSLSRLWAMRSDMGWLKTRLLPADAADARAAAKRELDDAVGRARKAADRATELAPDDPAVVRVKVDALRLLDDRAVARALAPRLSASALQPETAYVLAALDLSEPTPPWKVLIERLQIAASGEPVPGRARAALVYALASSGDVASARQELDRMKPAQPQYPLVPDLQRFLDGLGSAAGAGSADAGARDGGAKAVDIGSLPAVPTAPVAPPPTTPATTPTPPPPVQTGDPTEKHGEFSETELHKHLDPKPDDKKPDDKKPDKKPPQAPTIDTSDLPGVKPP